MTDVERKANFHKLFDGIKISGLTVVHSVDPNDIEDMFGNRIHDHVEYMRLGLDFTDSKDIGCEFIDSLTCDKLENAGLKPYNDELDKGYMLSLLNHTGCFDIKLESPYNNEEKEYLWENK